MLVIETTEFANWLGSLKDVVGRRAIVKRLVRLAATDHFGDTAPVGEGVSELRFHIGPGYRVYYTIKDGAVILGEATRDRSKGTLTKPRRSPPGWIEIGRHRHEN